jgi:acetolactate synthase regulatory subunit
VRRRAAAEHARILETQMADIAALRLEETRLRALDATAAAREADLAAAKEELARIRRVESLRNVQIQQIAASAVMHAERARIVQAERDADLLWLERLKALDALEAKALEIRRNTIRTDLQIFQDYISHQRSVEHAREKAIDNALIKDANKAAAIRDCAWEAERAARKRLLDNVMQVRLTQLAERRNAATLLLLEKKQERENLESLLEQHKLLLAADADESHQKKLIYFSALADQQRENEKRRAVAATKEREFEDKLIAEQTTHDDWIKSEIESLKKSSATPSLAATMYY